MAEIGLIRIDSRLIHGQVITKWRKIFKISKIIIVDDKLAEDPFMISVYAAAAPKDVTVKIYSVDRAKHFWEKNRFKDGTVLLLFQNVDTCRRLRDAGIPMEFIQIGGLAKAEGKKVISQAVSLNEEDMDGLKALHDAGSRIEIQIVPEDPRIDFADISKRFYAN